MCDVLLLQAWRYVGHAEPNGGSAYMLAFIVGELLLGLKMCAFIQFCCGSLVLNCFHFHFQRNHSISSVRDFRRPSEDQCLQFCFRIPRLCPVRFVVMSNAFQFHRRRWQSGKYVNATT